MKEAEPGDPVQMGGPPSLVSAPVRATVVIARQAFLKGSEFRIAASRPLNSGWGQEKRPKNASRKVRRQVSTAPFLDFTMTWGARQSGRHFAQVIEMEGKKNCFGWRLANLALLGFLAVACIDILTGLEHWPFGSYPMYSLLYSEQRSWLRLYGVTDGGEILLRGERDFAPFDEARLVMALERLQSAHGGKQKLDEALRNLMRLYDRRHAHSVPLRALRLYAVRWVLRPGFEGPRPPQERILVAQATRDDAEAAP